MTLALPGVVVSVLKSMIRIIKNIAGARHGAKWLRDTSILRMLGSNVFGDLGWAVRSFQSEIG